MSAATNRTSSKSSATTLPVRAKRRRRSLQLQSGLSIGIAAVSHDSRKERRLGKSERKREAKIARRRRRTSGEEETGGEDSKKEEED